MKFREFLNNGRNNTGEVVSGRYLRDLPSKKIADVEKDAISAFCAPPNCLQDIHQRVKKRQAATQDTIIKNVFNWNNRKDYADGLVLSLYERMSHDSTTRQFIGDPIADSLAIVSRKNSSILALADGVSWGHKSRLAAICSIYGATTYLNEHLPTCKNTRDVFRHILKAFERAQQCIVAEQATMTTLCVGVVVPLHEKNKYGFCVVNVGDSYAYVFNKHYGVKEVTEGSHPIDESRDMRHSGGALGPADGYNPDLSNLTCSFITLEKGDLVFLCSDGVSDNFDPMVGKFIPNFKQNDEVISISSSSESSDPENENSENIKRGNGEVFENITANPEIILPSNDETVLCSNCRREEYKNKRNSPELVSESGPNKKRDSVIRSLLPDLDSFPARKTPSPKNDTGSIGEDCSETNLVCNQCGSKISRRKDSFGHYKSDQRNSVLDFVNSKISSSTSMDSMSNEVKNKRTEEEESCLKSSSFTKMSTSLSTTGLEKEAMVAKLQNASSRGKLTSQPSVDEMTGRKEKGGLKFNENLTPRERREGALLKLNEIITTKIEMDEGSGSINVGEVCAQIINFVIEKTDHKRTILEQVPQSELNAMTSKEKKVHNESIKKQLEGVSGKLDHASIVCYEIGYHDNKENVVSIDPQMSVPKSSPTSLPDVHANKDKLNDGAPEQFKVMEDPPYRGYATTML